jgi:hypothetical protein
MSMNTHCRDGSSKQFDPDSALGPATVLGACDLVFLFVKQTNRVDFQRSKRENEAKNRACQRYIVRRWAAACLESRNDRPQYICER